MPAGCSSRNLKGSFLERMLSAIVHILYLVLCVWVWEEGKE